jgi:uncharacterized membrane protein
MKKLFIPVILLLLIIISAVIFIGGGWVAYRLTPESVNKKFERSNKFKEDLEILEIIHIRFNLSELIQYQPVSALD